jgi:hypothetical protein
MRGWLLVGGVVAAVGLAKLLIARLSGRGRFDVGAVSDGWLAQQRGESFDPSR